MREQEWELFGGELDLARGISALLVTSDMVYAGTAPIYGGIHGCGLNAAADTREPAENPLQLRVEPFRPNPFSPTAAIVYELPRRTTVDLRIYDVMGRQVRVLRNRAAEEPGQHKAIWDGKDDRGHRASAGVYFFRFVAGKAVREGKVVLLR